MSCAKPRRMRSQARRAMTSAFRGTMPCQPLIGSPNQLGTIGREGNPTNSIGKNIICKANQTWNQVKRRHTKGTDNNLANGIKSTGMPIEFSLEWCWAKFAQAIPIHKAVPTKTITMNAVKACRRMSSTTG